MPSHRHELAGARHAGAPRWPDGLLALALGLYHGHIGTAQLALLDTPREGYPPMTTPESR